MGNILSDLKTLLMLQRVGVVVLFVVAALAILMIVPPVTSAPVCSETVYIDPVHGNDTSGTGSAAAPWRSIKRALQSATAGDIINALAGTYGTTTGEVFYLSSIAAPTPVRRVGLTATSDGEGFDVRFDNRKFVAEGCPEFAAIT